MENSSEETKPSVKIEMSWSNEPSGQHWDQTLNKMGDCFEVDVKLKGLDVKDFMSIFDKETQERIIQTQLETENYEVLEMLKQRGVGP